MSSDDVTLTTEDLPGLREATQDISYPPPKLEHGEEIDLEKLPTRKERLGYGKSSNVAPYFSTAKRWAKAVMCPVCSTNMVMLKGRRSNYGETITYQCQAETSPGKYCLTVVGVTVGTRHYMRPGDFESCDYDWERIAEETIEVREGDRIVQSEVVDAFELPEAIPECPWERQVQSRTIWLAFWEIALENNGIVRESELKEKIFEDRPQDRTGKGLFKLNRELTSLSRWMSDRTGYAVKVKGNGYVVVGKAGGDYSKAPFSSEEYRKLHGMETL